MRHSPLGSALYTEQNSERVTLQTHSHPYHKNRYNCQFSPSIGYLNIERLVKLPRCFGQCCQLFIIYFSGMSLFWLERLQIVCQNNSIVALCGIVAVMSIGDNIYRIRSLSVTQQPEVSVSWHLIGQLPLFLLSHWLILGDGSRGAVPGGQVMSDIT